MPQKIVIVPSAVLRRKAEPVRQEEFGSKNLLDIIKTMSSALCETSDGIGIAAPQIGVSKRIFLASEEALAIDAGHEEEKEEVKKKAQKKKWKHFVFINPEVVKISRKKNTSTEGCLSVPRKYGLVPRSEKIRVRAYDEKGKRFERGASDLFARVLQHELDHLEGALFIDKAKKLIQITK